MGRHRRHAHIGQVYDPARTNWTSIGSVADVVVLDMGEHEREMMTNLDRTFHNLTVALRELFSEIRRSSLTTALDA